MCQRPVLLRSALYPHTTQQPFTDTVSDAVAVPLTYIGLIETYESLLHDLWGHTYIRGGLIHHISELWILIHKTVPRGLCAENRAQILDLAKYGG